MKPRSPFLGYNHNIRYDGRLYHVQTEDSGAQNPHIHTHLFHEGTILATKRSEYAPDALDPEVRKQMQSQHKAMLHELSDGFFDLKIAKFFGPRTPPVEPLIHAEALAAALGEPLGEPSHEPVDETNDADALHPLIDAAIDAVVAGAFTSDTAPVPSGMAMPTPVREITEAPHAEAAHPPAREFQTTDVDLEGLIESASTPLAPSPRRPMESAPNLGAVARERAREVPVPPATSPHRSNPFLPAPPPPVPAPGAPEAPLSIPGTRPLTRPPLGGRPSPPPRAPH